MLVSTIIYFLHWIWFVETKKYSNYFIFTSVETKRYSNHFIFISVHDGSGLVDNVADSGEESEDEWNYYKGDQKDSAPTASGPDQEVISLNKYHKNSINIFIF